MVQTRARDEKDLLLHTRKRTDSKVRIQHSGVLLPTREQRCRLLQLLYRDHGRDHGRPERVHDVLALRAMLHDLRITRYRQIAPDHLSAARAMRSLPSQRAPQAALRRLIERPTSPRPSSRAVVGSGTATMPAASRNALSMPVGRSHTFREPSALDIVVEPTPGLRSHDPHPATQGFRLVRGLCRK